MKTNRAFFRLLLTLALCAVSPALLVAQDSLEIGLEPVYPKLFPDRTKVVPEEKIPDILKTLPGWKYNFGHLYKIYQTPTFPDAVALIVKISYSIQKTDHHPEIRNIYGKVYVGFTTYDQGKKVTETDVAGAMAVEAAATVSAAAEAH